jgi:hypothetical protein
VKFRNNATLGKDYKDLLQQVKSEISFISYISVLKLIRSSAAHLTKCVKIRHANKLSNLKLGSRRDVYDLDVDKIVVNLSTTKLDDAEVHLLRRGLSYSISPQQLNSIDIQTSFECFFRQISNLPSQCISRLKHRLKQLCYSYIFSYKKSQCYNLPKDEFLAFKKLLKKRDILFCKPDKSNGIVIMDTSDYSKKLDAIINDKSKFCQLQDDPTAKREGSLQRYLRVLKQKGVLTEDVYNQIRPCGSNASRIYGLPKLHKPGIPLRPIVSAVGAYCHKLAKYLASILKPLTSTKFTVKDSFAFTHDVLSLDTIPFMCSFDVVSLFTNIPVNQTIEICLDKLFFCKETVHNFTRVQMKKLLEYCIKLNHFTYNGKYYDQCDGVAMGSPLGPILADIFMSDLESKVFVSYDGNLPIFYKRYVDDVFLAFNDYDDCELFLEYFNSRHPCIKFTLETEKDNCLPFLDVLVSRSYDGTISTSLYRKQIFSGLLMQFDSFVPVQYKKCLVSGLVHRAWKISSSYELFQNELSNIKNLLMSNGFPLKFINKQVHLYLRKKQNLETNSHLQFGPQKKILFISLPFCGPNSTKLKRNLTRVLQKLAPWSKVNIAFKSILSVKAISKLKSPISVLNKSNVVYKLTCGSTDCNEFYVGLTTRRLCKRIFEHQTRTYSAVFKHNLETGHDIDFSTPEVIASDNVKIRLQIKETLLIKQLLAYKSLNVNLESFECKLW